MPSRKAGLFLLAALLLTTLVIVATWQWADLPPPLLLLRHGAPNHTRSVSGWTRVAGLKFVRVDAGYVRIHRRIMNREGDFLGAIGRRLGIRIGTWPDHGIGNHQEWVELKQAIWISASPTETVDFCVTQSRATSSESNRAAFRRLSVAAPGTFRPATRAEVLLASTEGDLEVAPNQMWLFEKHDPKLKHYAEIEKVGPIWSNYRGTTRSLFADDEQPTHEAIDLFTAINRNFTPVGAIVWIRKDPR